jgi:predicted hydrolase (HD superfamily)
LVNPGIVAGISPTLIYHAGKVSLLSSENCESCLKNPEKREENQKEGVMPSQNGYSRERAWSLLNEYTQSASLLKHALGVETCVRAYGEREADAQGLTGEPREDLVGKYAVTGLLHDFDYEKYPTPAEHPFVGTRILAEQGWPEEIRTAILGHAEYSGVPRETHLAKTLFACDELAGFLTACSLVKPTKSIHDVETAGVRKKMKDKAFAKGVNRDDIIKGAEELGIPLDEHIAFCIAAMQKNAEALELVGSSPNPPA